MAYPAPLEELVRVLERFPGVGRRTAERLAFHVLVDPEAAKLGEAVQRAVRDTVRCSVCCNLAEHDPCKICGDEERDATLVLVVEAPRDVEAMERAGVFNGHYHVLMGAFDPAKGVSEEHLSIAPLMRRLGEELPGGGRVAELILGTDADAEGEATAALILEHVGRARLDLRTTRLARGLPAGSALEYLHKGVLEDALEGRLPIRLRGESPG